jgi:hypothetical protein
MENKNRNILVAVATVLAGGFICTVVATLRWCSVCRTSYFALAGASPAPN